MHSHTPLLRAIFQIHVCMLLPSERINTITRLSGRLLVLSISIRTQTLYQLLTRHDIKSNWARRTILEIVQLHIADTSYTEPHCSGLWTLECRNRVIITWEDLRLAIILCDLREGSVRRGGLRVCLQEGEVQASILTFFFLDAAEVVLPSRRVEIGTEGEEKEEGAGLAVGVARRNIEIEDCGVGR